MSTNNHYLVNIEDETLNNTDYRRVLYTARYMQMVVMSLPKGVEIGNEIHGLDQFIRVEKGKAELTLNNTDKYEMNDDDVVIIPAGTWHNVVNIGEEDLKLYTIYTHPEHQDGTIQPTKADEKEEHFDGITTADRKNK